MLGFFRFLVFGVQRWVEIKFDLQIVLISLVFDIKL